MRSADDQTEIREASQTLGLPPGASRDSIEEAYRNLGEAWHPEQFSEGDPRRREAEAQIRRLEEAYLVLKRASLPPNPLTDEWSRRTKKAARRPSSRHTKPQRSPDHGPSLLDDVFSSSPGKSREPFPVWLVVGIAVVVLVVLSLAFHYAGKTGVDENPAAASKTETTPVVPPPITDISAPVTAGQPANGTAAELKGSAAASEQPEAKSPKPASSSSSENVKPVKMEVKRAPVAKAVAKQKPAVQPLQAPAKPAPPVTAGDPGSESKPKLLRQSEEEAVAARKEQEALGLLRTKSAPARQLLEGKLEPFQFIEWKATARDPGQYWIDIAAGQKRTGQVVHFVWSVDPAKSSVKALSQDARDLETAASLP